MIFYNALTGEPVDLVVKHQAKGIQNGVIVDDTDLITILEPPPTDPNTVCSEGSERETDK